MKTDSPSRGSRQKLIGRLQAQIGELQKQVAVLRQRLNKFDPPPRPDDFATYDAYEVARKNWDFSRRLENL